MATRPLRSLALAVSTIAWLACAPVPAFAHGGGHHDEAQEQAPTATAADEAVPPTPANVWRTWGWEPGSLTGLGLTAGLYGVGLARLWRASGVGHGVRRWEAACFAAGWLTLFVALVSPIHPLGQVLFSVHMTQHELLMLIAAPLMVLGRPMAVFLRALPTATAAKLGRLSNSRGWRLTWGTIAAPFVAWLLHAAVLWTWHAPPLFQATLHNEWVHAAQHVSFLATALLFWWALIHGRRTAASSGLGVLYLFTTAVHSGLLGALLTFAASPWYPDYARTTQAWGMSPLEDQQLGGLVMWVPACLVYIAVGLALFAAWLRQSERQVVRWQAAVAAAAGCGERSVS